MADDVYVRVAHRVQQALRHLAARLAQTGVQGGHDDVELRQDLIAVIERAIRADFHFSALQKADRISQIDLQRLDLGALTRYILQAQAAGDPQAARMIGNGEHLQAARPCRQGHLPDRRAAIAPGGVAVQLRAALTWFDQGGQAASQRGLDLAAVLAQFWRNPGQAERRIDLRLGCA